MTRDKSLGREASPRSGGMGGSTAELERRGDGTDSGSVFCLNHDEPTRFDAERLEELCLTLGEAQAEMEVAEALKRIATTIDELDWLLSAASPSLLQLCLASLGRDADMIGMATLAKVAQAASDCLDHDDAVARAAAFARLRRIGERSIRAVWDLDDIS